MGAGRGELDAVVNDTRVAGFAFCKLPGRIGPEHGKDALIAGRGHKYIPAARVHRHLTLVVPARC